MPKLSAAQIAGIVKYSGGSTGSSFASSLLHPDTDGPIFVAIALAESGGVTDKVGGPNYNGSHDYGLWQINDKAHADLLKTYKWSDPTQNYQMAAGLYLNRGGKFTDWSSYKNGAYAAFMPQAAMAWGNPDMSKADKNPVSDVANSVGSAITTIPDLIAALTKASTWIRIGEGAAGALILIMVAVSMMKGAPLRAGLKIATGGVV